MSRRFVALDLRSRMHHQLLRPAVDQRPSAIKCTVRAVEAQAHLGGNRNMRRYGPPHLAQDGVQQFRFPEQDGPAARLVHRLGRAAEIEIYSGRAQRGGEGGVIRETNRVRTEQLDTHWRSETRDSPSLQFRR